MLFFDAVTLPKAVPRDGSCLRTANSMDIWNNAVAFLRAALRRTTRTLFSFQGAAVLFSLKEGKPETHGLKPTRNPPNRLGSNPAACGGFRSVIDLGERSLPSLLAALHRSGYIVDEGANRQLERPHYR
jgi:hypothetical protein